MRPKWLILTASLAERSDQLISLMSGLLPQTEPYSGKVRVCALWNLGERSLGQLRQRLIDHAVGLRAEYVSFVDDDDELPDYYVDEVIPHLTGVDYVGWQMQAYWDGRKLKPTFHSLQYSGWHEDAAAYYRDISHLNPTRLTAIQDARADFRLGGDPEDVGWADQLRGYLRTESLVNRGRVMYHYRYSPSGSRSASGAAKPIHAAGVVRPPINHPNFTYHLDSSMGYGVSED